MNTKDYETIIQVLLNKIRQLQWYIEEIEGKPLAHEDLAISEISGLKRFMDLFNKISNNGEREVERVELCTIHGIEFGETDCYIQKAMRNGQIYENRTGYYKKA